MISLPQEINRFRQQISASLDSIIGEKVIIPDAPYYKNIGDLLIWQGTVDFIRGSGRKLVSCSDATTFRYPAIDRDTTILLMGGGNFGDLWRIHQNDRLRIISRYPDNRIVMLPQSVCYQNPSLISEDAEVFARNKDLYLCARDNNSYDFLHVEFKSNNILLVPDMAFCISEGRLKQYRGNESESSLFLRRKDKELTDSTPDMVPGSVTSDWPTFEKNYYQFRVIEKMKTAIKKSRERKLPDLMMSRLADAYAKRFLRDAMTDEACDFMAPYSKVITTRLHALILAILLHKTVEYIDNSTGKISAFVSTWLQNAPEISCFPIK